MSDNMNGIISNKGIPKVLQYEKGSLRSAIDSAGSRCSCADYVSQAMPDWVRKPFYTVRGKSITPEQAKLIITREEPLFEGICSETTIQEFIASKYTMKTSGILNEIFYRPLQNWLSTWLYTDGTVGHNAYTSVRFPDVYEVVVPWLELGMKYDFLDMVVSVTNYEENPCRCGCRVFNTDFKGDGRIVFCEEEDSCRRAVTDRQSITRSAEGLTYEEWFNKVMIKDYERIHYPQMFYERVQLAIWLHDGRVDILIYEGAREKCLEYEQKYTTDKVKAGISLCLFQRDIDCICNPQYIKDCFNYLGVDGELFYNTAVEQKMITGIDESLHVVNGVTV